MAELRDAGIRLPIIANGGIRDFDDCREYFWAGADAVSLGSAVWLQRMPLYALGPVEGLRIRRLIVAGRRRSCRPTRRRTGGRPIRPSPSHSRRPSATRFPAARHHGPVTAGPAPTSSLPPDPVQYDEIRNEHARKRGLPGPYIAGGDDPELEKTLALRAPLRPAADRAWSSRSS